MAAADVQGLLVWLDAVAPEPGQSSTIADVCDGTRLMAFLHDVAPDFFAAPAVSDGADAGNNDNWALHVGVLKRLLRGIQDFHTDVLSYTLDVSSIDAAAIARDHSADALLPLLELVVSVVLNAEDKERFIVPIMQMSPDTQAVLMAVMQRVQQRITPASGADASPLPSPSDASAAAAAAAGGGGGSGGDDDDGPAAAAARDAVTAELRRQYDQLHAEHVALQDEAETLRRSAATADAVASEKVRLEQRVDEQLGELEALKRQLAALHDADFPGQLEAAQAEVTSLRDQLAAASRSGADADALRDQIDVLRAQAESGARAEEQVSKLRRRLQEMADVKAQLRALEERNTELAQQQSGSAEDDKRARVLQKQLDEAREKAAAAIAQVQQLQLDAKQAAYTLEKEKERSAALAEEQRAAEQQIEVLQAKLAEAASERDSLLAAADGGSGGSGSAASIQASLGVAYGDKLARLERENQQLRQLGGGSGGGDADERVAAMEAMVTEAQKERDAYESKYLTISEEKMRLEVDLAHASERADSLETEKRQLKLKLDEGNIAMERLGSSQRATSTLTKQVEQLTAELESAKAAQAQVQAELVDVKQAHSMCALDNDQVVAEARKQAQDALSEELAQAKTAADEAAAALAAATQRADTAEAAAASAVQRVSELEQVNRDQLNRVNATLTEKDELRERLDTLNARLLESEKALATAQGRCDSLSEELQRARSDASTAASSGGAAAELQARLDDATSKLHAAELRLVALDKDHSTARDAAAAAQAEATQLRERVEAAVREATSAAAQVKAAGAEKSKLEAEAAKLKGYIKDAKSVYNEQKNVIQDLQSKLAAKEGSGEASEAVKTLQMQLTEKDKEMLMLKRMRDETREATKREERLVMSAFYNLGMELQRSRVPGRRGPGKGTTWLARQRQDGV